MLAIKVSKTGSSVVQIYQEAMKAKISYLILRFGNKRHNIYLILVL